MQKALNSLFHYTTANGLLGILSNQSIWATHYQQLNDTSEYEHGQHIIADLITGLIYKKEPELFKKFVGFDGTLENATKFAYEFVQTALETREKTTLGLFLTSFCNHTEDTPEYFDGLLSMWRGYGADGGYAIEIAPEEFSAFNNAIRSTYAYTGLLTDVTYVNSADFVEDLGDFHDAYLSAFIKFLDGKMRPEKRNPDDFATASIGVYCGALLLKHTGFKEENEYRNIVMPSRVTLESQAFYKENGKEEGKEMPIKYYTKNGRIIPYIELSAANAGYTKLPIKRVIVGPHPDQERRIQSLKYLAEKYDFEIDGSGIPYSSL